MKALNKFSYIFFGLLVFAIVGLFPIKVNAEETKNMTIPFSKEYKVANFTFQFEDEQVHQIVISAPNGSQVTKESVDKVVTVSVYDIVVGTYVIDIYAEEPISVIATVEGVTGTVKDVGDVDISVTSVISGLKKYFVDGDLCLEWDDTGLGSMNIKITNPATMQVIASDTVNENFYRCSIDSKVENVEIYIVPSSEARIYGAGITYTIPVVRDIEGNIVLPDFSLTNEETISFDASVLVPMSIKITENGDTVSNLDYEPGDYEITIPLNGINNDIVVTLIEKSSNNQKTYEFNMIKDMVAPTLSFEKSYDNLVTTNESFTLSGTMKAGDILYVNNFVVDLEDGGKFNYEVPLVIGDNTIAVCAADDAGNEFPVVFKVTRREAKKSNAAAYIFLGGVCFFVILIILAIVKVVSMKKKKPNDPNLLKKEDEEKKEEKVKTEKPLDGADLYRKNRKMFEFVFDIAPMFVVSATLLIIFVGFLQIAMVSSGSMEPTLKTGSVAFYNRLSYKFNNPPERGDIILFNGGNYSRSNNKYLTKRVIGIPGDEIVFYCGDIYINGMKVEEGYISEELETNSSHTFIVPENSVFVLGDNRESSIDSRFFENPYVSYEDIKGKYFGSFYVDIIKRIFIKEKKE